MQLQAHLQFSYAQIHSKTAKELTIPRRTKTPATKDDLQSRKTEGQPITAVLQKRGCSASVDSFFV